MSAASQMPPSSEGFSPEQLRAMDTARDQMQALGHRLAPPAAPLGAIAHQNIASQCRATASHPFAHNVLVDDGSGMLAELLTDAAQSIETLVANAAAGQPAPDTISQPDKLEQVIDAYVEDYECMGENAAGTDGYYSPNEHERYLIKDAIMGLLADQDWDAEWGAHIANLAAAHGTTAEAEEAEPSEIESVIACLGDDAASLRDHPATEEIADNMDRAAELLQELSSRAPVAVGVEPRTGPNYEAGLWSRRNHESMLEDQRTTTPAADLKPAHKCDWADLKPGPGAQCSICGDLSPF
ncbi:hypothetical protein D9M73_94230 [compost metagenome]